MLGRRKPSSAQIPGSVSSSSSSSNTTSRGSSWEVGDNTNSHLARLDPGSGYYQGKMTLSRQKQSIVSREVSNNSRSSRNQNHIARHNDRLKKIFSSNSLTKSRISGNGNGNSNSFPWSKKLLKARNYMKKALMFQYGGKLEIGFGKGVEREVLEAISKQMVITIDDNVDVAHSTCMSKHIRENMKIKIPNSTIFYNQDASEDIFYPLPLVSMKSSSSSSSSCSSRSVGVGVSVGASGPVSSNENENENENIERCESLYCCGLLIGHLLLRRLENTFENAGSTLGINLPLYLWKLVMQKQDNGNGDGDGKDPTLEDLASFDVAMHQSLTWMLENKDEVGALGLYFTANSNDPLFSSENNSNVGNSGSGYDREVELISGGSKIPVTYKNVEKYVKLLVLHCMQGRMEGQALLLREGILAVIPSMVLSMFTEHDLYILMTGGSTIDTDDWRKHSTVGYNSNSNSSSNSDSSFLLSQESRIIHWFWKLVDDLTKSEKCLLLRFCTGCSRVPIGGFSSFKPPFTITINPIYSMKSSLPTASTCFNLLKLPYYPNEHLLRKNILIAITYGSEGFSFS